MRKLFLLTGIIPGIAVFLASSVWAQSLPQGVALFKEAKELNDKARSNDDREKALVKFGQALDIFRKHDSKIDAANTLDWMGFVNSSLKRYDKALENQEQALSILRKLNDTKREGGLLETMGDNYSSLGKREKAIEHYETALVFHRKLGTAQAEGNTLGKMGNRYHELAQYKKALACYEQALPIYRKLNDPKNEAQILHNSCSTYIDLEQYHKAKELCGNALEIRRKIGDPAGSADTLYNIGMIDLTLGDPKAALGNYGKALEFQKNAGDLAGQGRSLTEMGVASLYLSQYQQALEYFDKALPIHKQVGDRKKEAATLSRSAWTYWMLGQYDKALEYYDKALVIIKDVEDLKEECITLTSMGLVYTSRGQYPQALEVYERALDIATKNDYPREVAAALFNRGLVYSDLGQYQNALKSYDSAAAMHEKIGALQSMAVALDNIGSIYDRLGQYEKAQEQYEKALALLRKVGAAKEEADALNHLGQIFVHMQKYDGALSSFQKALDITTRIGLATSWSNELIGNLYLDRGELTKAEPYLKKANAPGSFGRLYLLKGDYSFAAEVYSGFLGEAEKTRHADRLFTVYTGLGKAYEGMEDYKKAEEYYEKAMRFTEEIRSGLLPSERQNFFEVKVNGFQRSEPAKGLTRVRMKLNEAAGSIDSSEATRARAFSDNIALTTKAGSSGVPTQILKQDEDLAYKVAALKKQLNKTDKDQSPVTYENISRQAKESEAEMNTFVAMLWQNYKSYASVKYPRPVTLKESALKPDEYVVIFDASDEGVGVKLIKGKKIAQTFYTDWKSQDLEKDIKKFRQPFEEANLKEFDSKLGRSLYQRLLLAVLAQVPEGAPIVIIPDGILAILPFEALVVSGQATWKEEGGRPFPDGLTYLGDVYPISYYQSITALSLERSLRSSEKPGSKTLVIADPVFDPEDPRLKASSGQERQKLVAALPDSLMSIKGRTGLTFPRLSQTSELANELRKLSPNQTDLFTGMQAKKSILFDKPLTNYGSIIFATHGYFGKDIPGIQEPVLAMTLVGQPKDQDGFLRMTEVMGMKLNADVVALTACQTGLGSNLSGEGVMSMGRAFQYAGAKSILMSLWSVSESGSVMLVEKFFEHLNAGKNRLQSLKLAREDVRNAGYKHPFYWAPFILVGEVN
jgi:tetratricopeptide (TPR) repeat protein